MLLNRETASEIVRLLSEGFDLPVRIYLSLWYKPIACAYSKRLCKHFVNDVELLKKATPYNDGCILFYWTPYGECSVLLCGNSQQYIILGPVTLDSTTGGEDFPLWDLEGFQTIHNLLPVFNFSKLETIVHLCARILQLDSGALKTLHINRHPRHDNMYSSKVQPLHAELEYRNQLAMYTKTGNHVRLKLLMALYIDLSTKPPTGPQTLRMRKDDLIGFLSLMTGAATEAGMNYIEIRFLRTKYMDEIHQAETLFDVSRLYAQISHDFVVSIARKSHTAPSDSVLHALSFLDVHFMEPITVRQISEQLALTAQQLNSQFREDAGISLSDYVSLQHLSYAKLLLCTEMPIAEIAAETLFPSASSMSAAFKKFWGITPMEYRRLKLSR